jgi:hypothetical protein
MCLILASKVTRPDLHTYLAFGTPLNDLAKILADVLNKLINTDAKVRIFMRSQEQQSDSFKMTSRSGSRPASETSKQYLTT